MARRWPSTAFPPSTRWPAVQPLDQNPRSAAEQPTGAHRPGESVAGDRWQGAVSGKEVEGFSARRSSATSSGIEAVFDQARPRCGFIGDRLFPHRHPFPGQRGGRLLTRSRSMLVKDGKIVGYDLRRRWCSRGSVSRPASSKLPTRQLPGLWTPCHRNRPRGRMAGQASFSAARHRK